MTSLQRLWSTPAALRAVRATLVVPGLFAFCYGVLGDLQVATFAAFGGFATLVLAAFGGRARDKVVAHLGLALAGSVLIVIGTAVNTSVVLATVVTLPVVFVVLFAGVGGPNAASGSTAALLAYVLPAASPGAMDMVPARLAGWWLASIVGTVAVLLLSPKPPGAELRLAVARNARALADQLGAALRGDRDPKYRQRSLDCKHNLLSTFTSTPYRPTGLAAADQALDSLVGLLEWCTSVICDSLSEYDDLTHIDEVERRLLADTATVLRDVAALLEGEPTKPELDCLERSLADSVEHLRRLRSDSAEFGAAVHLSFHARTAAVAAHTALADALIASHRADPAIVSNGRRRWYGTDPTLSESRLAGLTTVANAVSRHANPRSVWFLNSARGAIALAAAVAVADLTGVEHGFWVVLGTLSVLRTSAASTGSTVLRALLGTVVGFVIGAALLIAIGSSTAALWTALPLSVLIAAYAPAVLPFAAGQAAFTLVVCILFNLLVPAGWEIGVVRIEDVAIGCAVSFVVGVLFWPRGAGSLVADDLADAFRTGGLYLSDAAHWALGLRADAPAASAAIAAGIRLDEALRSFLAEQGTKRVPKEYLWRLVAGALRARLTAHSLAGLPAAPGEPDPLRQQLGDHAGQVAAWFDHLASRLDRADHSGVPMLAPPQLREPVLPNGTTVPDLSTALWVGEHLKHVTPRLMELVEPAGVVAAQRHRPWWR
ncbi:FUSC family protein [Kutzneria kofuensis]|uniref:Putative membrane protein YccC n=1 Tax=Kutzneria kofuensis TaxID=103725 RepID=A0A7W9KAW8_9PSEU|nr:FUSC family protein [Kutzneria kofuensis]MBB5889150.1 putative membrane protein YccC [Kutzneria kofuensis]